MIRASDTAVPQWAADAMARGERALAEYTAIHGPQEGIDVEDAYVLMAALLIGMSRSRMRRLTQSMWLGGGSGDLDRAIGLACRDWPEGLALPLVKEEEQ